MTRIFDDASQRELQCIILESASLVAEFKAARNAGKPIDQEALRSKWQSIDEKNEAIFRLPGAPYTAEMDDMGYETRRQLKRDRTAERAEQMGLVDVEPGPWMQLVEWDEDLSVHLQFDACLPSREETGIPHLLSQHMVARERTRSEAVLDAIYLMCAGTKHDKGRDSLPGSREGTLTFCYDAFEGGSGYDELYVKKADPSLYPIRWLVREWSFETSHKPLPVPAKEIICEATGGLIYAHVYNQGLNPKIERDWATRVHWMKQGSIYRYDTRDLDRWTTISSQFQDWDLLPTYDTSEATITSKLADLNAEFSKHERQLSEYLQTRAAA